MTKYPYNYNNKMLLKQGSFLLMIGFMIGAAFMFLYNQDSNSKEMHTVHLVHESLVDELNQTTGRELCRNLDYGKYFINHLYKIEKKSSEGYYTIVCSNP